MLCLLLYRIEHFSRGEKGRKGAEEGEEEGVASKRGKKEKRTRENRSDKTFREIPPGLLQHVLTVLVSGPGFCSCPGFHPGLGASDCSPDLSFCFTGP